MKYFRAYLRELRLRRPLAIGATLTALGMFLIGFLPLFGGPGYEHALATGVLVPPLVSAVTALEHTRQSGEPRPPNPLVMVLRGIRNGVGFALLSLLTAFIHLVHVPICAPFGDLPYFCLTAGMGCALGGVFGSVLAEVLRSRSRRRFGAIGLSVVASLVCIGISVSRFYRSPMIFAFDPFAGYFSGTLYDTIVNPGVTLYTYRLGTVCTITSVLVFASALGRGDDGRIAAATLRQQPWRTFLGVIFAVLSLAHMASGPKLGHYQTKASITEALGGRRDGARCTVIHPRNMKPAEVDLLVNDCDADLAQVEATLETKGPRRITAFFFRDADEKKRLMGAANTYIAKPWREEVYLQIAGFPHPVLGHELAHVVAGSIGRGPFKIAGEWGGLVPNPGLIEGIATFASPDDDDLSDVQWARAMKDLGILPPIARVFSLGFLGESSAKSYTLAGAFVKWVVGRFGMTTFHRWYGGARIEEETHLSFADLDREFRAYLDTVEFPQAAKAIAEAKFMRPGVFGRSCPHLVDRLRGEADACRDIADVPCAREGYARTLAKEPRDFNARLAASILELRLGDREKGKADLLAAIADPNLPKPYRDRAEEALGDQELASQSPDLHKQASQRFRALAAATIDEDVGRSYDVKVWAAEHEDARPAAVALLIGGTDGRGPDQLHAGALLGELTAQRVGAGSSLALYLLAKNLAQHGLYADAAAYLARLAKDPGVRELPLRVQREIFRQRAIVGCARTEPTLLDGVRADLAGPESPFAGTAGGRRDALIRLLARCIRPQTL